MLDISDERLRVIIYILASSGIRIGALPSLSLKHLQKDKLTIYENSSEEYITFVTPECQRAIESYLDMRSRYGKKLSDESFLIREQFDVKAPSKP